MGNRNTHEQAVDYPWIFTFFFPTAVEVLWKSFQLLLMMGFLQVVYFCFCFFLFFGFFCKGIDYNASIQSEFNEQYHQNRNFDTSVLCLNFHFCSNCNISGFRNVWQPKMQVCFINHSAHFRNHYKLSQVKWREKVEIWITDLENTLAEYGFSLFS